MLHFLEATKTKHQLRLIKRNKMMYILCNLTITFGQLVSQLVGNYIHIHISSIYNH